MHVRRRGTPVGVLPRSAATSSMTALTIARSSFSELGGSSGPSALAVATVATHVRKSLA